ncbi:stage II sporulation protein D [Paenibacillus sp. PR3]|uniref:Stage II sporulation protein D n=2 Tax=Paenibacillus terricola TaxID=2763503 RepID=A0ABR8N1Z1_9BACL|nr:stage II sporulation protein D [Paenibacillus terricola]
MQFAAGIGLGVILFILLHGGVLADQNKTAGRVQVVSERTEESTVQATDTKQPERANSNRSANPPSGSKTDTKAKPTSSSTKEQSSRLQQHSNGKQTEKIQNSNLDKLMVHVYLTKQKRIETVPLELYVRGVLAGEMPIDFELEALKAQAIATRTYIVRRLAMQDRSGVPGEKADVTDTVDHQVYVPLKELAEKWPAGEEQKSSMQKLTKAVEETSGEVLTYQGEPIEAAFFSTSNGYTENVEDYWQLSLPYLKSVASPWDEKISPRYKQTVEMKEKELYRRLGAKDDGKPPRILETTEGHRVKTAVIGGKTFTGREVREKLDLPSSQFEWTISDGKATITTYGLGHGIGLSQWGANGMAKEGASAAEILLHYYTGVKLEQAYKLPE